MAFVSAGTFKKRSNHGDRKVMCEMKCGKGDGSMGFERRDVLRLGMGVAMSVVFGGVAEPGLAARPEGVNRPELLPKVFTTVVDLEKFLTTGERSRLEEEIDKIEKKTNVKLRVLTQRYPQTPGLAVRDYWSLDDNSILLVADFFGGTGNLLKFNVGEQVYEKLPPRFWSLLSAKYGNTFYVRQNGEDQAILNSITTIKGCLYDGGCKALP